MNQAGNVDASIRYAPTTDGSEDTGDNTNLGNRVRFTLKGMVSYKNLGGAYRNFAALPDYVEWVTADNVGVHFAGAVTQGTLARGLMVGLSLNNSTGYPDVWPHIANIKNIKGHPYSFYQKMGFVITGVVPDANGPGKPDILMAKRVRET